jgi:hypothetical protein
LAENQCCIRYGRPLALVMLDFQHFKAMSFFVRGPDGVLVELVQAAPSSELCPKR